MVTGREAVIPIVVYGVPDGTTAEAWLAYEGEESLDELERRLHELEGQFGAFMHSSMHAWYAGAWWLCSTCGMEHAGATVALWGALYHELAHSWFVRGVMPANGNAEWLDEGIVMFIEAGMPSRPLEATPGPQLSGWSPYRRHVTMDAYEAGQEVMEMLHHHFADSGGLQPILVDLYDTYAGQPITTEDFVELVQGYSDVPLDDFFAARVYAD
jgi:hypothetical protein